MPEVNHESGVIYVDFQASCKSRETYGVLPSSPGSDESLLMVHPKAPGCRSDDPSLHGSSVHHSFSLKRAAQLLKLHPSKLQSWRRQGIFFQNPRKQLNFEEIAAMRSVVKLLASGVRFSALRSSVKKFRENQLNEARSILQLVPHGRSVVVRDEVGIYDPITGQTLFPFALTLAPNIAIRREAYRAYARALDLEKNGRSVEQAKKAYREAISLDPSFSVAKVGLAQLYGRSGNVSRAESLLNEVLIQEPEQAEALYALGCLASEREDFATAIAFFEKAVGSAPAFTDAIVMLAIVLEEQGNKTKAKVYWMRYLDIEPSGMWSELARRAL